MSPLLLFACVLSPTPSDSARTCDDVLFDEATELAALQTCTTAAECGQVLTGTSCGCTRDAVVRLDADPTPFRALQDEAGALDCDGGESTCDCPEAYGFDCVGGACAWDYTDPAWTAWPDCHADHGDPYDVDGFAITGDTATVTVGYGGGCATHTWTTCWPDQAFAESDPVQATLELFHDNGDDPCDAWFVEDQSFDLTPLRDAWRAAYGVSSGTILVHVGAFTANYDF